MNAPRGTIAWTLICGLMACLAPASSAAEDPDQRLRRLDEVSICDCLLPPQIRGVGRYATYAGRSRSVRTTVRICKIRGGEYVILDRADFKTALNIWMASAKAGDAEAQQNVGHIYEMGLGTEPDYARAAEWYQRAAEQGLKSAQVSLGYLYERGLGVPRDSALTLHWYRLAAEMPQAIFLESVEVSAASPPAADPAAGTDHAGPVIRILEPPQHRTRGLNVIPAGAGDMTLIGRATSPFGIFSVVVDGRRALVDSSGLFQASIPPAAGDRSVRIAAVDRQGARSEVELKIEAVAEAPTIRPAERPRARIPEAAFGRYVALVIANTEHTWLPDLVTPARDAEAIADILRDRYGFKVRLLFNATMYDVLSALNDLRKTLNKEDNLLIYYAGHGQLDQESMQGYWLSVDAELGSDANWIPTSRISTYLQVIPAKQILIISDSCFSGALTRSSLPQLDHGLTPEEKAHWYRAMATKKARVALTSGGLTPVMDAGGGDHSVFNKALTDALLANHDILEAQQLYREVAARVAHVAIASGLQQEPECAPIRHAGHEAGDFLFVPTADRRSDTRR